MPPFPIRRLAVALAVAAGWGGAWAQPLPTLAASPAVGPLAGHSAHHYGMADPAQQEASIRTVLINVGVDQAFVARRLGAETARFLVGLVLGGVGAPTDLATSDADMPRAAGRD
ncbi:hypothetical protein [Sinimarinibacterium thermocellulolyticum]|uniref:Uncharacterized protein n=1 Tax=Sinimarinibacterium thermocellulolyticum TaxID=3170016 RepID=A0ABV2A7R1_9GAMM